MITIQSRSKQKFTKRQQPKRNQEINKYTGPKKEKKKHKHEHEDSAGNSKTQR
jgi:hypothetical protein